MRNDRLLIANDNAETRAILAHLESPAAAAQSTPLSTSAPQQLQVVANNKSGDGDEKKSEFTVALLRLDLRHHVEANLRRYGATLPATLTIVRAPADARVTLCLDIWHANDNVVGKEWHDF